ncbi:MAG: hypothetical protein FJ147_03840 [Deltaproteobacteria bacterium]|nr:hypothetical protein [Deltaproteobacteria bacterium]
MIASEDTEQAAYHNRVERLCDPTHVRALPESEFNQLFAVAGLQVLFQPTVTLSYSVAEWMDHGGPDEATAREIVALLEASVDVDRTGLNVRREDGVLRFSHSAMVFLVQPAVG